MPMAYNLMASSPDSQAVMGLVREVLKMTATEARASTTNLKQTANYFLTLSHVDYQEKLRKQFDPAQVRETVREFQHQVPALNRRVLNDTDLGILRGIAANLGADLQPHQFEGREGSSLRGFYVNDASVSARPLIVVNTAVCDPVGVAAAFWHEVGHHLTHRVFGKPRDAVNHYFKSNYADHLDDPEELLADLMMILGAYPRTVAKKLFSASAPQTPAQMVLRARQHLRSVSGLDFPANCPVVNKKLHILAGLMHGGKLREALLAGYNI
jgi:hypothetical protein